MNNTAYLDERPAVDNKFKVKLVNNEKVLFASKLDMFGNQDARMLGVSPKLTLTNKRIILNNGAGVWTIDIAEDIVSFKKVAYKSFLVKGNYFAIDINSEIAYDYGRETLTGFRLYFKKKQKAQEDEFEELMNNLFN